MNTDFLHTLSAVAQHGSMAEAARRLGLTHGAVAQQVRKLEQELGVPLVARAGRTVHLTAKATELIAPMREVLERIEKIRYLARSGEMMGELRLGAGNTALNSMVPAILEHLVGRHPLISVEIQPGHSARFYPAIESGELDAAIALEAPYPLSKSLGWQLLREEPYVLAAAPRHAGRHPHSLLTAEPFIRYQRSDWSGRHVDDYLRRVGITPRDRFELNAIESIAVMVSRDLGVAILPRSTNGTIERLGLLALPLPEHCEPRRFGLIWSRVSPRLALIQAFRDIAIMEYAKAPGTGNAATQ
ncbi:LysR family transcriptional regulator [Achromobacter spanius]|uniref:LysR family transcriptional regulator n=1 Tax=Achromobacter spanius TaxID=217203 RepID=UPI003208B26D